MIPLCIPELGGNELEYLRDCLETNWVSYSGSYVTRFEEQVAGYVGTQFAVATNSGTSALHTALLVAGVRPNEEVLVSGLTFVASANAIRYCGAWPVFMDVTRDYWQFDPQKLADFLTHECEWRDGQLLNRSSGRRVSAVLPVHILGHSADMNAILDVSRRYELPVIEDASQCLGGEYRGRRVGQLGDMACFSFNGNKIITTGGGGMITTNNEHWARRAKYLTTQARDDAEEYIHEAIGYNYRLTNLQAAVGVAQMEKLDSHVDRKRQIAARYARAGLPCELHPEAPWARCAYWLYTFLLDGQASRHAVLRHMASEGIQCRPLWRPIHRLTPYLECQTYQLEVANDLYERGLSVPSSVGLTEADQSRVVATLRSALTDLAHSHISR